MFQTYFNLNKESPAIFMYFCHNVQVTIGKRDGRTVLPPNDIVFAITNVFVITNVFAIIVLHN